MIRAGGFDEKACASWSRSRAASMASRARPKPLVGQVPATPCGQRLAWASAASSWKNASRRRSSLNRPKWPECVHTPFTQPSARGSALQTPASFPYMQGYAASPDRGTWHKLRHSGRRSPRCSRAFFPAWWGGAWSTETGERRKIEDVLLVPGTARVAYATITDYEPRLEVWDEAEAEVLR